MRFPVNFFCGATDKTNRYYKKEKDFARRWQKWQSNRFQV